MDEKQIILSYQDEISRLRSALFQLDVSSIEQKATDEVRKWREQFDTSSSSQLERLLDEMETQKQTEANSLANELRISLDQFKEKYLNTLDELEVLLTKIDLNDEIQWDYIKFQLDLINKKLQSLNMDIVVKVVDVSPRQRSSSILAQNKLELVKVFNFEKPKAIVTPSSSFLEPIRNLFCRTSASGARWYQVAFHEK